MMRVWVEPLVVLAALIALAALAALAASAAASPPSPPPSIPHPLPLHHPPILNPQHAQSSNHHAHHRTRPTRVQVFGQRWTGWMCLPSLGLVGRSVGRLDGLDCDEVVVGLGDGFWGGKWRRLGDGVDVGWGDGGDVRDGTSGRGAS